MKIDGKGFAPQLTGKAVIWPRDWIFVQLGQYWYDREKDWKLNQASNLFDMRNAPFAETLVPPTTQDEAAIVARKRLQAVLDELNPAGGIVDPGMKKRLQKKVRKANRNADATSGNANEPSQ